MSLIRKAGVLLVVLASLVVVSPGQTAAITVDDLDGVEVNFINSASGRYLDSGKQRTLQSVRPSGGWIIDVIGQDRVHIFNDSRKAYLGVNKSGRQLRHSAEAGDHTVWSVERADDGRWFVRNDSSGKYLAVGPGRPARLTAKPSGDTAKWFISPVKPIDNDLVGTRVLLASQFTNRYLDTDDDRGIGQSPNPRLDDQWLIRRIGGVDDGSVSIESGVGGYLSAVAVDDRSLTRSETLDELGVWTISPTDDGTWLVQNTATGLWLDADKNRKWYRADLTDDPTDAGGRWFVHTIEILADRDGDGFEGPRGDGADCNDDDPSINPDAEEVPGNGVDEDCDGFDTPTGPASLTVAAVTDITASLTWEPAQGGQGPYTYLVTVVEQGTTITTGVGATSVELTGLEPLTDYTISVVTTDSAGIRSAPVVVELTTDEPVDRSAPTAPGSLTASGRSAISARLSWQASTDDVGVVGYRVFVDGVEVRTTAGLTVTVDGLVADQTYAAAVEAFDAAGNVSPRSTATIPVFVDPGEPCGRIVPVTTINRRSNLTIPDGTATPQYTRPDVSCLSDAVEVDLTNTVNVSVLAVDGAFAFVFPDGATQGTWIDLVAIGQNESINQFWTVGDGSIQEGQTIEYQLSANTTLERMFYNMPISVDFAGGRIGFYLGFQSRPGETYVWTSAFKSGSAEGNAAAVIDFEANGAVCSERDDEPGIFDTVGCDTGFRWEANTTYTLRWTVGEQVGTARWFRASIEGPGTAGVQLPSYLIETGATDNPLFVRDVTNFTEQFSGFEDCVPPPPSTGADFGAPQIAGRSLAPSSTSAIWCVDATITDSTVIPGGRLLRY